MVHAEPVVERAGVRPWIGDAVLTLTALLVLLKAPGPWYVRTPIVGFCALALVVPAAREAAVTWFALALLVAASIVADWPLLDNHIYLLAYWCLALGLARSSPDPAATLAAGSRWLVAFAFCFAVLWKGVLSPDYRDGRFFRITLVTDDRFADLVMLVGGMTPDQLAASREAVRPLPDGAELATPVVVEEPARFVWLVRTLTWGGLALEGALAMAFVIGRGERGRRARLTLLIGFCLLTYAFAPVAGFGWLLLVMGLAQCRPDERGLAVAFVAGFVLVLVYSETPWAAILNDWWPVASAPTYPAIAAFQLRCAGTPRFRLINRLGYETKGQ